ncbi:hypothetical protein BgiMline_024188, partial [Biomphalaria glabrata]
MSSKLMGSQAEEMFRDYVNYLLVPSYNVSITMATSLQVYSKLFQQQSNDVALIYDKPVFHAR